MRINEVEFGQWLPDQADYKNPGLVEASNVYPSPGGYTAFESSVLSGNTVSSPVVGAQLFFQNDGTTIVCGGTATTLFVRDGTISTTNPPYSSTSQWQFERFSDLIVAVSKENAPQYLTDIDTDLGFSDLPGSPPKAAVVGRVGDFLVLGDLEDIASLGSPNVPNRVRWSAFNNPTTAWVTDRGELSDYRDLDPKYGRVTAIVGGRWGLVFQERAIWRMTFVGAPKVFEFDLVADDRGAIATGSVVNIGYETFFLDTGGFFVTNGSDVVPIGDEILNGWFEENSDSAQRRTVHASVNWPKRCIVWAFREPGGTTYTRQVIYSFVTRTWANADIELDYLVSANQDALTLADLATLFPGGLGTMSAYEIGTLEWQAKDRLFAAFVPSGSNSEFATFSGAAREALFTTGDYSVEPGRRALVSGLRPMIEVQSGTVTCQTLSRASQGATQTVSAENSLGADGYAPFQVDDWFHAFRVKIAAGSTWAKAKGLWVRSKRTGKR